MKYINKRNGLIYFLLVLAGCIGIEPMGLETKKQSSYKESDYKGIVLSDGPLFDFKAGPGDWWSDKKYTLSKQGNTLKVVAGGVGPGYEPFGVNFDETDFTNTPILRVRMKLHKDYEDLPAVRIDLKDLNDYQTNGSPATNVVEHSDGFVDYYYDLNHKFKQSWPEVRTVDQRRITALQIFVNPGGKAWSGTFYIDEIYVMANKDGSGVVSQDILIDDFKGDVGMWWPCKREKVDVAKEAGALKISIKDGQWDCFGRVFAEVDVTNTPVIRIRAKAQSETPVKSTNIMARFIDANENATDLIDGQNMREMEVGGSDYIDYYFSFKDNLFSSSGDFDKKKVNRVIIFINMNKEANYTGDVFVKEIAFINRMPLDKEKEYNDPMTKPSMCNDCTIGKDVEEIDNFFNATGWSTSSNNLKLGLDANKKLQLTASNVGPNWEYVGKAFEPMNLYTKQYLKLTVKATGNTNPAIRIDLVDDEGLVSNGRPQSVIVDKGAGFKDYYYDMTNNFLQRHPEFAVLNAQAIKELRIYVNGGLEPYTGEVVFDRLSQVSFSETPMGNPDANK